MSDITDDNPIIKEAYEEMQRFYANPETRDKARQRRQFIFDYNLGMNASREEGEAKGKAETIVFYLTRRFGSVPQALQDNLLAMTDMGQLDKLRDLSYDCESLADFEKSLANNYDRR